MIKPRNFTIFILHLTFAIAALSANAYEDVQVVYRGRLYANGHPPAAQTLPMTFRLYAGKTDTKASWSVTNDHVMVDGAGLFQVSLSGEGLVAAIDAGKANWIGVAIDGEKEQYPRQALLASPGAGKAALAERLVDSPSVATAAVESVSANAVTLTGTLSANSVEIPSMDAPVSMEINMRRQWATLEVKGKARFFSGVVPRCLGPEEASGGGCSFGTADCNCAALFTSENSDIMPGMMLFFRKDQQVKIPTEVNLPAGTTVTCRIYPIGVE